MKEMKSKIQELQSEAQKPSEKEKDDRTAADLAQLSHEYYRNVQHLISILQRPHLLHERGFHVE